MSFNGHTNNQFAFLTVRDENLFLKETLFYLAKCFNMLTGVHLSPFFTHTQTAFADLYVWMGLCDHFMSVNMFVSDIYDFKTNAVKSICAFPKLFSLLTSAVQKQRRCWKHKLEEFRDHEYLNIAASLHLLEHWMVAQRNCCIQPLRSGECLLQQIFYSD